MTRTIRRIVAALAAATALTAGLVALPAPAAEAATRPQTVVSLTFDDGNANQMSANTILNNAGLDGTFYITSGFIGGAGYLTRANLTTLKNAGHEIGGHTVNHPDLATLPDAEVRRQVCTDRNTLIGWGFAVRSFAYPFASSTPANERAVAECGYNSARMLGDIRSRFGCAECDYAETRPPENAFYTKALDQVDNTWTLQDLKNGVTNAEANGGGWVQFTFHNVCASGCDLNVTPNVLRQFAQWLAPRASTNNTIVRTVGDVVGGAVKPTVQPPATTPTQPTPAGVQNASLELVTNGVPNCWMQGGYGTNTAAFSMVAGRTGGVASRITMSNYADGDAKLLQAFDLGQCAPAVTPGTAYKLGEWYTSTGVTQFAVYLRTSGGAWQYWTSSPWFAASSSWTQATWTTPAIPQGFTGISFGLNVFANGTITVDDASLTK